MNNGFGSPQHPQVTAAGTELPGSRKGPQTTFIIDLATIKNLMVNFTKGND